MNFGALVILSLIIPIFSLIIYIMIRAWIKNEIPDSRYTPFDKIMGQTVIEFHEQKENKAEEKDQGDDKDKNKSQT